MSKQRIEIEVDVPEGFVLDGVGDVETDRWFVGRDGLAQLANYYFPGPFVLLKKVEPKRETRWMNLYDADGQTASVFSERNLCEKSRAFPCVAIVRIDYENGAPVSAALEPLAPHAEEGGK